MNFIVNIRSGKGSGERNINKIISYCDENNIDYNVHITNARGHATQIAAELVESGAKTIVAVGGDGTFHEVLNGITSFENTSLGFIPSGTGNDFARCMNIPTDPIKALKIILNAKPKFIDYIQIGDDRCLNIAGTGLDIDVLQRMAGRQGKMSYLSSFLYCVRHFEPYDIDVTLNGETVNYKSVIVGICNGNQFGGGLKLSPNSKVDDGILDLIIINMPPSGRILLPLIKFLRGKHLNLPITKTMKCEEVVIHPNGGRPVQLDGEIYEGKDLDCKIIKGGIRTFEI